MAYVVGTLEDTEYVGSWWPHLVHGEGLASLGVYFCGDY